MPNDRETKVDLVMVENIIKATGLPRDLAEALDNLCDAAIANLDANAKTATSEA